MTLKPTQSALWLRPPTPAARRNLLSRGFNAVFGATERAYVGLIGAMTRRSGAMMVLALLLVAVAVWGLVRVPTGFLPDEDQGYLIVSAQLPDGASKERTDAIMQQISKIAKTVPGVDHPVVVGGLSILDNMAHLANAGVAFVVLNEWDARQAEGTGSALDLSKSKSLLARRDAGNRVRAAPPPIQGIGNVSGFSMQVEIKNGDFDYTLLQSLTDAVIRDGRAQSALQQVSTTLRSGAPQLNVTVDRIKAETLGITVGNVFPALAGYVRIDLRGAGQQVRTRVSSLHAGAARLPRER